MGYQRSYSGEGLTWLCLADISVGRPMHALRWPCGGVVLNAMRWHIRHTERRPQTEICNAQVVKAFPWMSHQFMLK
jgi:hypothetical protein